jgi:hypothetical protein
MNTIADSSSGAEIRRYARPRAMLDGFSTLNAPKSSGTRVLLRELNKPARRVKMKEPWPFLGGSEGDADESQG